MVRLIKGVFISIKGEPETLLFNDNDCYSFPRIYDKVVCGKHEICEIDDYIAVIRRKDQRNIKYNCSVMGQPQYGNIIVFGRDCGRLSDMPLSYDMLVSLGVISRGGGGRKMIYKDAFSFVASQLSPAEVLAQVAEEAAELAKAARKLERVMYGKNYTPVTRDEAENALFEEIADVNVAVDVMLSKLGLSYDRVTDIEAEKLARWARRLGGDSDG